MHFPSVASLALLAVASSANPLPDVSLESNNTLVARAAIVDTTCNGVAIPKAAVQAAFTGLKENGKKAEADRPANGATFFPHYYGASDPSVKTQLDKVCSLANTDTKQYWEFPLFKNAKVYDGGDPGSYRIVAKGNKDVAPTGGWAYCLSMYHIGDNNEFLPCT